MTFKTTSLDFDPSGPWSLPDWRMAMAELTQDCAVALREEQAALIRRAHTLMGEAPDALQILVNLPAAAEIERLIEAGAWECAALDLLPADGAYLISRGGGDGAYLATVVLGGDMDGEGDEHTGSGLTFALALIAALAAGMARLPVQPACDPIADKTARSAGRGPSLH